MNCKARTWWGGSGSTIVSGKKEGVGEVVADFGNHYLCVFGFLLFFFWILSGQPIYLNAIKNIILNYAKMIKIRTFSLVTNVLLLR